MTSKEKFDWIKENISIVDYASSIGFTPVRKGKYYSLKEHDSIIIDTHKNVYWQNSISGYGKCIGEMGSIIDFAMKFCNMSFYEVIRQFEGDIPRDSQCQVRKEKRISDKTLKLPAKDANMRKVYAYLIKTRNIKPDVVQFFVDNKMLYQDKMEIVFLLDMMSTMEWFRCSPAEEVRTHLSRSMVMLQDAIMPNAFMLIMRAMCWW